MTITIAVIAAIVLKFVGYCVAGFLLRRRHPSTSTPFLAFGFLRTVLGLLIGVPATVLGDKLVPGTTPGLLGFAAAIHAVAWVLALLASPGPSIGTTKFLLYTSLGVAWSFLLDIPIVCMGLKLVHVFGMCSHDLVRAVTAAA